MQAAIGGRRKSIDRALGCVGHAGIWPPERGDMSVSLRKKRAVGKARRKPPAKRKPPVAKRPRAKAKPAAKVARRSKPRKAKARRAPLSVANIYHPGPLIDDE